MPKSIRVRGIPTALPDQQDAVGSYSDRRGSKTFLFKKGAGYILQRIDRDDPAVELEGTFIGSRDAAGWLAVHGCSVPEDLRKDLQGRFELDENGKAVGIHVKQPKPLNGAGRPEEYVEALGAVKVMRQADNRANWKEMYERCKASHIEVPDDVETFKRTMQRKLQKNIGT